MDVVDDYGRLGPDRVTTDAALAVHRRGLVPATRQCVWGKQQRDAMERAGEALEAWLALLEYAEAPLGRRPELEPACPQHGTMQARPPGSREQEWCGVWFACLQCERSGLAPSVALRGHLAAEAAEFLAAAVRRGDLVGSRLASLVGGA